MNFIQTSNNEPCGKGNTHAKITVFAAYALNELGCMYTLADVIVYICVGKKNNFAASGVRDFFRHPDLRKQTYFFIEALLTYKYSGAVARW